MSREDKAMFIGAFLFIIFVAGAAISTFWAFSKIKNPYEQELHNQEMHAQVIKLEEQDMELTLAIFKLTERIEMLERKAHAGSSIVP